MKTITMMLATLTLAGCASGPQSHLLNTGLGAIAGGGIGSLASHGNPAITAGIAGLGALAGEGVSYLQTKAQSEAFTAGYDRGRSDAVKTQYWLQQSLQGPQGQALTLYPIPVSAQEIDGINFVPSTKYIALPQ